MRNTRISTSAALGISITFMMMMMMISSAVVNAMPMFLVTSGRGKCISLTEPEGSLLQISYQAPDLVVGTKHKKHNKDGEGPVWITANTVSLEPVSSSSFPTHEKNTKSPQPLSRELKVKEDMVQYEVPIDGQVNICIRASAASTKNPMRFGLLVERKLRELEDLEEPDQKDTTNAHHHALSKVEEETSTLRQMMYSILKEADFAKQREQAFHAQSQHMNAASMWWPIVQLGFLLCMGFTQVSNITGFFKSRHII